jgi:hypothetical protein
MPQDDRRYIKASEYKQDCMFKRFRARANPGLLGVIKDIKEDLLYASSSRENRRTVETCA